MAVIDVQKLCQQAVEVLRQLREEKTEYVITHQGRPIAVLLPVDADAVESTVVEASRQAVPGGWDAYARAAERVRQVWPAEWKAKEVLGEIWR
jgi:prevent-host-death family protein